MAGFSEVAYCSLFHFTVNGQPILDWSIDWRNGRKVESLIITYFGEGGQRIQRGHEGADRYFLF